MLRGLIAYVELKRTRIDLWDIALMNQALDVDEENRARVVEAARGH